MSLRNSLLGELAKGPRTAKQLRAKTGANEKKILKTLKEMQDEERVQATKGVYALAVPSGLLVQAKLVKLAKTFGFAAALDGSGDIFIPGHGLHGAMPGDEVEVALAVHPRVEGSREGEVTAVLVPNNRVVGTVVKVGNRLALVPDSARETPILIKRSADGGVQEGEKAAGQMIERGADHADHRVGIALRFGSADSARQCAKAILYAAGVEKSFTATVKGEARRMADEKLTKDICKRRKDLRDEAIFTIDSETTKDIDDAISAKKTANGYKLGVHIADVSHYVRAKTALDEEAAARGTSIYYADAVIPMLPRALSNGICSLNPGEDRLAFSCLMKLDEECNLVEYKFEKTLIRSAVQGVYKEINAIFEGTADDAVREKYACVEGSLPVMEAIYRKLAAKRAARGSMELESDEAKLVMDGEGNCVGVEKRERGEAERMIEEFMLLANHAAAHMARELDIPFVYRVHDKPSPEKVEQLKTALTAAGVDFHFTGPVPTQTELAKLLDDTRGTNLEQPVHTGVLRSMAKAKYEPEPKGHYGLALDDYTHFTSPIRRYPDLAIHRILSELVRGATEEQLRKKYTAFAATASQHASERELVAQQVERNCDSCYKAEYMRGHIGEHFDSVVTSVAQYGIYVGLPNTIEGLVHISHLSSGRMELVEGISLTDPVSGKSYRIGDTLRVTVAGVDVSQGHVDFVPAGEV